jgi:ubiquinone/menaquinone biosynthesis C-methylase UbiE
MNWKSDKNKKFRINSEVVKNYFNKKQSLVFTDEKAKHEEKELLKVIKLSPNANVLDLGCGDGRWANLLENKIQKYVGVDFSEVFVKKAKGNFDNRVFSFHNMSAV